MTPKEKAFELYKKYGSFVRTGIGAKRTFSRQKAVDIAIVAINDIIEVIQYMAESDEPDKIPFWLAVKDELKLLA